MATGPGAIGRRTREAVESWVPGDTYEHERGFQQDLQHHLDETLNRGGMLGSSGTHVVEREHGRVNADLAVDDTVGIELKRNFTNSQAKKLRGQIEEYRNEYDGVIVCACGIDDMSGWRRLQRDYTDREMGMEMKAPVRFVHKPTAEMGRRDSNQRGNAVAASPGGLVGPDGQSPTIDTVAFEELPPWQQLVVLAIALVGVAYLLLTVL